MTNNTTDLTAEAQEFQESFIRLLEANQPDALAMVTGMFVSLVSNLISASGEDATKEIQIDGGMSRDITIHAVKQVKH